VPGDENWAQEILEAGRASRRILDDSLLETQIVRHQAALVVTETARLTNLHYELIGATRGQFMQDRGHFQPAGPGDLAVQATQVFTHVGRVTHHVHPPVGIADGDQLGHLAGVGDLAGAAGSP
jgi:hypothetical protein